MSTEDVRDSIEQTKRSFRLLRDERAIFERWEQLVVAHNVKGKLTHDSRLVAAMLRHGISHLLTFNAQDFSRFFGVAPIEPQHAESFPAAVGI